MKEEDAEQEVEVAQKRTTSRRSRCRGRGQPNTDLDDHRTAEKAAGLHARHVVTIEQDRVPDGMWPSVTLPPQSTFASAVTDT